MSKLAFALCVLAIMVGCVTPGQRAAHDAFVDAYEQATNEDSPGGVGLTLEERQQLAELSSLYYEEVKTTDWRTALLSLLTGGGIVGLGMSRRKTA